MDLTWYQMPQQQQHPGFDSGGQDGHAGAGHGGSGDYGGDGGGGGGGGGEGGGSQDSYGYGPDAGIGPGRGVNPGRGYAGPADQPGGRGRDPGWDKPGGYDYGPNGDVVTKVDPVTQEVTFRVYGQAYQDWFDAQLEDAREKSPIAGWIGTALSKTTMGRIGQMMGRMFGQEIHADGSPVGGHARGEPGESETAMNRIEEEAAEEGEPEGEKPETTEQGADEAWRSILERIRGDRGTTDWQTPDWDWIWRQSGLEPPERGTG